MRHNLCHYLLLPKAILQCTMGRATENEESLQYNTYLNVMFSNYSWESNTPPQCCNHETSTWHTFKYVAQKLLFSDKNNTDAPSTVKCKFDFLPEHLNAFAWYIIKVACGIGYPAPLSKDRKGYNLESLYMQLW